MNENFFFSTLQLTCNIRNIRKFHLKMLKNHQDFAFFVDPFNFELYKNLERTNVRNLSFLLTVHHFVLDLCNVKSSFFLRGFLFFWRLSNNNLHWDVTTVQWFCNGHDKYERNDIGVLHVYIYSWWIYAWH